MVDYKEMYLTMFRATEKARRTLLEGAFSIETVYEAVKILEKAQIDCETLYINTFDD